MAAAPSPGSSQVDSRSESEDLTMLPPHMAFFSAPAALRANVPEVLAAVLNSARGTAAAAALDNLRRDFDRVCYAYRAKTYQLRVIYHDRSDAEVYATIYKQRTLRDAAIARIYGEAKTALGGSEVFDDASAEEIGLEAFRECVAKRDTLDDEMYDLYEAANQGSDDSVHESEKEILDDLVQQYDEISERYRILAWRIYTGPADSLDEKGIEDIVRFYKDNRKDGIAKLYKKTLARLKDSGIRHAAPLTEHPRVKECVGRNDDGEQVMVCKLRRIWSTPEVDADKESKINGRLRRALRDVNLEPEVVRAVWQAQAEIKCAQHRADTTARSSLEEGDREWKVAFLALRAAREIGLEADAENAKGLVYGEWLRRMKEARKSRVAVKEDTEGESE